MWCNKKMKKNVKKSKLRKTKINWNIYHDKLLELAGRSIEIRRTMRCGVIRINTVCQKKIEPHKGV